MQVKTNRYFDELYSTLDIPTKQAIAVFVGHVEQHGLRGLVGRNKSSTPTNPRTKKQKARFAYAQKHCLWHYHIGIPYYVGEKGDMTSEYILHYQRFNDEVILVDLATHPPFELPTIDEGI